MATLTDLNWLAIVVSVVLYMVIGALWYSPILFAKPWTALINKSEKELQEGATTGYISAAVLAAVEVTFLAIFIKTLDVNTLNGGLILGIMMWVGFVAPTSLVGTIFKGERKKLWLIDFGYHLLTLGVIGALLAVWS